MPSLLADFFEDLDQAKLRIERPKKFLFLCGGTIGPDGAAQIESLRDYLYRIRSFSTESKGEIVRAETATQLYRDTGLGYGDLISFEEDIARIATVVLVIAESPGSLAELGAFAGNNTIRRALRIIVQDKYWKDESFIRFGPLQRIYGANEDFVGIYPWVTDDSGTVVPSTADPHYDEIVKFINRQLDAAPKSEQFSADDVTRNFYIIYWIVYLAMAIPLGSIVKLAQEIIPNIEMKEIRNKIYCMKIAGWIDAVSYSNKTYFYVRHDKDPFAYAFKKGVIDRDSARRKLAITEALTKDEDAPEYVRKVAIDGRAPS